ncbi:MAG: class I tRNA ligase family protein [Christensenellales bacterium]
MTCSQLVCEARPRPLLGQGAWRGIKRRLSPRLYTVLETISRLIAPFTPFMAEAMYQNMVRSVDKTAPESVHLCDFPVYDASCVDLDMERQMKALLEVIQLGRACRNLASLKVRQPVAKILGAGRRL